MAILKSILEAQDFLENDNSYLSRLIVLNEKFESDIMRQIANSDIFKRFDEYQSSEIPSKSGWYDFDPEKTEEWLKLQGKSFSNTDYRSFRYKLKEYLGNVSFDKIKDSDFIEIDKSDARRKKYSEYTLFWFNQEGQLAAVSLDKYVYFITDKRKVFTGEHSGNLKEIDTEDNIKTYNLIGDYTNYQDKEGNKVELKGDYKTRFHQKTRYDKKDPTTLELQKNPYLTKVYGISPEVLSKYNIQEKNDFRLRNRLSDKTNDEVKAENLKRYETQKSKLIVKRNENYYKGMTKSYKELVKDFMPKFMELEKEIEEWKKNYKTLGYNYYNQPEFNEVKNVIRELNIFFGKVSDYNEKLDKDEIEDSERYERDLRNMQSGIDGTIEKINNLLSI